MSQGLILHTHRKLAGCVTTSGEKVNSSLNDGNVMFKSLSLFSYSSKPYILSICGRLCNG